MFNVDKLHNICLYPLAAAVLYRNHVNWFSKMLNAPKTVTAGMMEFMTTAERIEIWVLFKVI